MAVRPPIALACRWLVRFGILAMLASGIGATPTADSAKQDWAQWIAARRQAYYRDRPAEIAYLRGELKRAQAAGQRGRHDYWLAAGRLLFVLANRNFEPSMPLAKEIEEQIPLARSAGDTLGLASMLVGLARFNLYDHQFDRTLELLDEAERLATTDHIVELRALVDLIRAATLLQEGDVPRSLPMVLRARDGSSDALLREEALSLQWYAEMLASAGESDLSAVLDRFKGKLQSIDLDQRFYLGLGFASMTAEALVWASRPDDAIDVLGDWKSKAIARGIDPRPDLNIALAAAYASKQMWRECVDALAPLQIPDRVRDRSRYLVRSVTCRAGLKDPRALEDIHELERLAASYSESPALSEELRSAIERAYAAIGDFRGAYAASLKTREATTRRLSEANEVARKEIETKYKVGATEHENALLRSSRELLEQRRNVLAWGLVLAAVALALVARLLQLQLAHRRRLTELSASLEMANAKLQRVNVELTDLNASRTRLLAAACHDLRQPAHALGLLAELAAEQVQSAAARVPIEGIKYCSTALSDMLDMLLDMTQLESERYVPSFTTFSLADLLQELRAQFEPMARKKGLSFEIDSVDLRVRSDRHLLRRMLMNLVSNAIKYTMTGSVRVEACPSGEQAVISVVDTGPGIPDDKRDSVFAEYVRLDAEGQPEGLGIGLPIVKRAAELLDHGLQLESGIAGGTRVSLKVPLVATPSRAPAPALAVPSPVRGHGKVIAVLEDDESIRTATAQLLTAHDFVVAQGAELADVKRALQAVGRTSPDLLISDFHLPHQANGLQIMQFLREHDGWAHVAFILLTGDLDAKVAGTAATLGISLAYKPVKPRRLLELVDQLLLSRHAGEPGPVDATAPPALAR